jgi:hypothetical protein
MQLLKEPSETSPTKDFTQENPIIFKRAEERSRTRAIQLSAHRACLLGKEQKTIGAARCMIRTHETRNLAAPRRARPRSRLTLSSSARTLAHRTDAVRAQPRPGELPAVGTRTTTTSARPPPRSGANWASLSDGEPIPVRDRFWHRPLPCAGVRLMLMPRQLLVSDCRRKGPCTYHRVRHHEERGRAMHSRTKEGANYTVNTPLVPLIN